MFMFLNEFLIIFTLLLILTTLVTLLSDLYKEYTRRYGPTVPTASVDSPVELEVRSSILFTRNYTAASNVPSGNTVSSNSVLDALLDYIAHINTVNELKYTSFYVMNTEEEFVIDESRNITGQVEKMVTEENTGAIKLLSFYVRSRTLSIVELREWVEEVHIEYITNKNNELGSKRFFFNQLPDNSGRGEKRLSLQFDMLPFDTTKTLDNLYGEHIDRVQSRVELFNNKLWYHSKGVPHTLGILLYGEPGCGKTSLIKAIANDTHRHVFNIRLNDNMTKEQLSSLFFDTKIYVRNKESNTQHVIDIPLNQRLYVLEDIDCAKNTVLSREEEKQESASLGSDIPGFAQGMFGERELDVLREQVAKEKEQRIDLAFFLNILDGILETPQRLIIMTTNYPQKLDKALLRPGRIDLILEFKKCTTDMLVTMVQNFFSDDVDVSGLESEALNEVLTPAEVQEILCNYIDDADEAVQQIQTLAKKTKPPAPLQPPVTRTAPPPPPAVLLSTPKCKTGATSLCDGMLAWPESKSERVCRESTNVKLCASDAEPEPQRECAWLKYQM